MSKLHGECILLMSFFSTFASLFLRQTFCIIFLFIAHQAMDKACQYHYKTDVVLAYS